MSLLHSISQVFENNMGNRITPELAAGMIRGLVAILAAGVRDTTTDQAVSEQSSDRQEENHGVV